MTNLDLLLKSPVFKNVGEGYLDSLLSQKDSIIQLKKNEFLFHQGEEGKAFYVLLKGCLETLVEQDDITVSLGTFSEKIVFGEVSVFASIRRTASIKAVKNSTIFCLRSKIFTKHIEQNNLDALRISYNILEQLGTRLANTTKLIFKGNPTIHELVDFRHKLAKEIIL